MQNFVYSNMSEYAKNYLNENCANNIDFFRYLFEEQKINNVSGLQNPQMLSVIKNDTFIKANVNQYNLLKDLTQ